ncbi:sugar ABC transporter substrate-binding protein [Porcincola intestinalis]|uniref:sugar ABC transporter substrate-binding protein n=1 Tax=Porcincola intestinalis TaxID=2606632 RepID=UPI002A91038A|nr:substrate-binding domain-containing protein [Porcincola intestinalis]
MKEKAGAEGKGRKKQKMMKKVTVAVVSCLSVIGLILLGTYIYYQNHVNQIIGQPRGDTVYKRHYLFISSDTSDIWQDVFRAASEAAGESGAYLEWCGQETSARYSDEEGIEIGVAEKVDGILLYESTEKDLKDAVSDAQSRGIPVVTLLRDIEDSPRISYVGFSNYERGRLYGDQLVSLLHKGENKVCVLTDNGDSEGELNLLYSQMTQAVKEKGADGSTISLSAVLADSGEDFDAEETIRNLLMGDSVPDILICETSVQTDCAIQTIIDNNLVDRVQVIGYYTADMTLSAIQRELIPAALTIDTDSLGHSAVAALNEYLDTGHVSDYYNISLQTVNAKNVYQYLRMKNLSKDRSGGEDG